MPSGVNTTSNLTDSLDTVVQAARITREYDGVMPNLVDRVTLGEGIGNDWREITLNQLTATSITETTELENGQQVSDTALSVTPTMVGLLFIITDRLKRRMAKIAYARLGELTQNAIQRKKDEDGLVVLDGGTSLSGAGTTLASGIIRAASARITGNTTEPGKPPIRCVLHPWQIKDLADELVSGVGTYPVEDGPTADVFKTGFKLPIAGVDVFPDGNITIDSSNDAKGGVFAKEGIVLVQGKAPWTKDEDKPGYGGGATAVYLYDEYAYAERLAAGTTSAWLFEVYSDCTAPTS